MLRCCSGRLGSGKAVASIIIGKILLQHCNAGCGGGGSGGGDDGGGGGGGI